jgi:hypothetical protein
LPKARAFARALGLFGGGQTGSEKAQYPGGSMLPEQWGSGFDMKAITGGLNSLIMTAGYHAFGGEGFANDYSKMNWNNMTYSAYDLGSFLGSEVSGFFKERQGYDAKTQQYDETKKHSSGWFEDLVGGAIKWSEASEKAVKGFLEGIGASAVNAIKNVGQMAGNLFQYGVFATDDSDAMRRIRQIEESQKYHEMVDMYKNQYQTLGPNAIKQNIGWGINENGDLELMMAGADALGTRDSKAAWLKYVNDQAKLGIIVEEGIVNVNAGKDKLDKQIEYNELAVQFWKDAAARAHDVDRGGVLIYTDQKTGQIMKIISGSADGMEMNTYKFDKNGETTDTINLTYVFENDKKVKDIETIYTNNMSLKVVNQYCDNQILDSYFFTLNSKTNDYEYKDMNKTFIDSLERNVVGQKYVPGGGQSPVLNGQYNYNFDDALSWKGYDCTGGILASIYNTIGISVPWSPNPPTWLDEVNKLNNGNLILVDYRWAENGPGFDHAMTYYKWTDADGTIYNLTTTAYNNTITVKNKDLEKWQKFVDGIYEKKNGYVVYKYYQINWGKILQQYGSYNK